MKITDPATGELREMTAEEQGAQDHADWRETGYKPGNRPSIGAFASVHAMDELPSHAVNGVSGAARLGALVR